MGFLRSVFGPSKDEIWQQLSQELDGTFHDGGFWGKDFVEVNYLDWTVRLDTYTVSNGKSSTTYTRLRAPFQNKDNFRFTVYREHFFATIGKFFGMQDVVVGYPAFDDSFIIKGNSEDHLKQLFASTDVRNLLHRQPQVYFQVKDDEGFFNTKYPEGVDLLYFQTTGIIKDLSRLKELYELFAATLNQLCLMGSAYEGSVDVNLR